MGRRPTTSGSKNPPPLHALFKTVESCSNSQGCTAGVQYELVRVPGHFEGRAAAVKAAQRQCTVGRYESRDGARAAQQQTRRPTAAVKSAQRQHHSWFEHRDITRPVQQQSRLHSGCTVRTVREPGLCEIHAAAVRTAQRQCPIRDGTRAVTRTAPQQIRGN